MYKIDNVQVVSNAELVLHDFDASFNLHTYLFDEFKKADTTNGNREDYLIRNELKLSVIFELNNIKMWVKLPEYEYLKPILEKAKEYIRCWHTSEDYAVDLQNGSYTLHILWK